MATISRNTEAMIEEKLPLSKIGFWHSSMCF